MIKSRTTQLIYEAFYCAFGLIGTVACLGIFDDYKNIFWNFYIYFTNLSNFLCIGIIFAGLCQTAKKKEDSFVSVVPKLKFIAMLGILLTFLVFNLMLANEEGRDPQLNWKVGSLLFHVVLPLMFIGDWFLFYEHKKVKWYYPLLSTIFPLSYVAFVFIRAAILKFDASDPYIYPYFFLNPETQGDTGVIKWIVMLSAAFIIVGYLFTAVDCFVGKLLNDKQSRA